LISSTTETWLSRLQTVEIPKSGISINNLSLSEQDTTTNLGISRALERQTASKSGAPIQAGGKFSDIKENNLLISKTKRYLMLVEIRILKVKQSLSTTATMEPTKDGRSSTLTKQ
jgi:hypothetical protein